MKRILSKKMPLTYAIGLFLLAIVLTIAITRWTSSMQTTSETVTESHNCITKSKRIDGYELIKPILYYDDECPSENLSSINGTISSIINTYKQSQNLVSASVYFRDFETSEWTSVNETEQYEPGSLFKVATLIAALKMSEQQPGLLNKKIAFSKKFDIPKNTIYQSKTLQLGQSYTLRELLTYMIVHSDNDATALVQNNINTAVVVKLFNDLGLETPSYESKKYFFTAQNYSLFMRLIYNASYLNEENSAFAAQLLSQSTFQDGIVKGLPANTRIAHKFGEAGNASEIQLHESALVYLNDRAYLLTIMTKGKDLKTLSNLLAEISKAVYDSQKDTALSSL